MKFSVQLTEFQKAVQKVVYAIPPKSTLPVLEHIHFSLKGNLLELIATDQEISILTRIQTIGEEDGKLLVPARRLNEIVKAISGVETISFEIDEESYEIVVKTSAGKYEIKGMDSEEYINIPELFAPAKPLQESFLPGKDDAGTAAAKFKRELLMWLCDKTNFAVSTDEYRAAMTGVLFQFRSNYVNAVATDSFRLAKATIHTETNDFPDEFDVIIPSRSVDILKKTDSDVEMSIIQAMNKTTHLRFNYDNTIFVTRVINEKFPPYEIVIQQNPEFTAYFVKPEILGAIRRVAILSNFTSKQIRFFLDKEILKIHGHDEDTGSQGDETVNVSFNGSYTEFCFNYKFLDEAIQNIDLSDPEQKVYMTYTDPTRPIIIKSDCKGDDLMMLIMPIKLSS